MIFFFILKKKFKEIKNLENLNLNLQKKKKNRKINFQFYEIVLFNVFRRL